MFLEEGDRENNKSRAIGEKTAPAIQERGGFRAHSLLNTSYSLGLKKGGGGGRSLVGSKGGGKHEKMLCRIEGREDLLFA